MPEPFIIRRAKAQAAVQQQRELAHSDMIKQNAVTTWFEGHELKKANPKQEEAETAQLDQDLKIASEQLTKVRRERLRQLYAEELAQWQSELAAKGLTIDKRAE